MQMDHFHRKNQKNHANGSFSPKNHTPKQMKAKTPLYEDLRRTFWNVPRFRPHSWFHADTSIKILDQ